MANKLASSIEVDVKVNTCGAWVDAVGLKKEKLADGVTVYTLSDLCRSVKASKNILFF